ncbi:hypothetical protein F7725_003652 [Dissostichus mawsoni]|uniref:Immunoglobulin V-set domain-containing protein n=1 Tax=Dissostichus mawsoni TaxID=36200 RepID=A0A7J5YAW5_DISMA|nr:hypothetical protein F7725_003652 [Dissostichus mawsoni]
MLSAAAEEEKLHQVTFNTNHVLCSSAAAAGCWILCECEQLTQPASVTVQPGQRLTITCQLPHSLNQTACRERTEWIGSKYTGATYYKDSLKSKFSIDLDSSSNTVTLNGQSVQPGDSACPSICKVNFLTVCYKDLISCCQLQQKKRSSIRSPSTPTMFSVALLLLLLAAGSCESH